MKNLTIINKLKPSGNFLTKINSKRIFWVVLLVGLIIVTGYNVYSYFSKAVGSRGNVIGMANVDLEIKSDSGESILPLNAAGVYPGWSGEIKGQLKNTGTKELIFRTQLENKEGEYSLVAKIIGYDLIITDEGGNICYEKQGYLDQLDWENRAMNILINPAETYHYRLLLNVPSDIDDPNTPENDDDNQYQGIGLEFDLIIQSTQVENVSWEGFPEIN